MNSIARATAVVIVVLCASSVSWADGTVEERQTAVKLYRGSSIIAASDPKSDKYVAGLTPERCEEMREAAWQEEALTRDDGRATYKCQVEQRVIIEFHASPAPTCGDRPGPDEHATRTCPPGTVGTWQQDRLWTLRPYPECWVQGDWTPAEPPAVGMCAPVDSDGDGVPDVSDACPTVYASTPNGCPATPPSNTLPAPVVTARAISNSAITLEWNVVAGAWAFQVEQCAGASCTDFRALGCREAFSTTHNGLTAGATMRYRVRSSRDRTCSTNAGNLGAWSAIVSGTTLANSTPVNCAVGAWSAWSPGTWSACSGGQQSRTETRTRTVTTQPANGGTACPELTERRTTTQPCGGGTGSGTLPWTAPTRNTDGSELTDLAGYRVVWGQDPNALTNVEEVGAGVVSYTVTGLTPGTWYFAVKAFTTGGRESDLSTVQSKVVQ